MKFFSFLIISVLFFGCGKTALDKPINASSSMVSANSCQCTSEYFPVCGKSGKSFENQCLLNCFGDQLVKVGQCQCRNDFSVCGIDNNEYSECEAQEKNIQIKKFSPCSAQPI